MCHSEIKPVNGSGPSTETATRKQQHRQTTPRESLIGTNHIQYNWSDLAVKETDQFGSLFMFKALSANVARGYRGAFTLIRLCHHPTFVGGDADHASQKLNLSRSYHSANTRSYILYIYPPSKVVVLYLCMSSWETRQCVDEPGNSFQPI